MNNINFAIRIQATPLHSRNRITLRLDSPIFVGRDRHAATFARRFRGLRGFDAPKQKAERKPSSTIIGAAPDDAAGTEDL